MNEKIINYFNQHRYIFFTANIIFIVMLLKLFQITFYPDADFTKALTPNNISFLLFGYKDEIGGLVLTFLLAIISIILSFIIGSILGVARYSSIKWIKIPAIIYIELFRALPLIMVIFWIFFAIPIISNAIFRIPITLSAFTSAIIAFTLFESAYIAEIVRAGLNSISKGQFEAGKSLGMNSFQIFIFIILPQAYRKMIPAILSQFVSLFKDTSLVYIIGVVEFFGAAKIINSRIYMSFEILSFVAMIYFIFAFTLSKMASKLEKKVEKQLNT